MTVGGPTGTATTVATTAATTEAEGRLALVATHGDDPTTTRPSEASLGSTAGNTPAKCKAELKVRRGVFHPPVVVMEAVHQRETKNC